MSPGQRDGALTESPAVDAAAKQVYIDCAMQASRNAIRRAAAARRCVPVEDRYGPDLAARDPWLEWPVPLGPRTYGLSPAERRREAERLLEAGWGDWEVVAVLASPVVAA